MASLFPMDDDAWWAAQTSAEGPHAGKVWWGWGLISELRAEIAAHLSKDSTLRLLRPPTVEEAARKLPEPRITIDSFPEDLQQLCTTAPFERLLHARGRDMVDIIQNIQGNVADPHDLIAYPETEGHLSALLAECQRRHIAIVPFGGGSSVVGGVAPPASAKTFTGCVAVDLAKMNRVLKVDATSHCALVQAGIYGPALEAALRPTGLTLRHFPQSFEFSTLGGWLATRGGGHFATGPTHVDEMVQSVRVLCPSGATQTRQLPASGAGPAEHRLYLGSEGSLGLITEAWLRLRPRPAVRASATIVFTGATADAAFQSGARALQDMSQTGFSPANLRLVYGPEVVRTGGSGLSEGERELLALGAVLLIGFESPVGGEAGATVLNSQLALLMGIAESKAHGGMTISKSLARAGQTAGASGERDGVAGSWGKGFMRGGYLFTASCLLPTMIFNTVETACTWEAFPSLHAAVLQVGRDSIRRICGVEGEVTCRVTHVYPDGPAPYYTFMVKGLNEERGDRRIEMWLGIKREVMAAVMRHGGTSTHHHAVGRLHQEHYKLETGALWPTTLAAAKAVHDPRGIMNPGMLVGDARTKL